MNEFTVIFLLLSSIIGHSQAQIENEEFFQNFFESGGKNLLVIGENHSSSVASDIVADLIEHHNKQNGLRIFILEFGPSEAYFYSKYLETGNEKYFGYTIYAGYYKDWKKAWRKIYDYNQTLDQPLKIKGVDFDRGRTFAYALYNILKEYPDKPESVDSLMNVIKTQEFYETYTIGHPTARDKEFIFKTRKILESNWEFLDSALMENDLEAVSDMVSNKALDFGPKREKNIEENISELINISKENNFLMLVGRDHAYKKGLWDNNEKLAKFLKANSDFQTLTGVILHENSQQWDKDFKNPITLFEIKDKDPWKKFSTEILDKANSDLTIIPLENELSPLLKYMDYILVAKNKGPIEF